MRKKLLNEMNKKGIGDVPENMFCLVVGPYNISGRLNVTWSFLVEAR